MKKAHGSFTMRECTERIVKVGFRKKPKKVFDEIDMVTAEMIRDGWFLRDTVMEDGLGYVHLFFEREITMDNNESAHMNQEDTHTV